MTPDELRALAGEATPGPWRQGRELEEYHGRYEIVDGDDGYVCLTEGQSDAHLIALAPSLALLCADLATALSGIHPSALSDYDAELQARALAALEALERP